MIGGPIGPDMEMSTRALVELHAGAGLAARQSTAAQSVVFLQPQNGGCVVKLSLQASFDLLFFLLQDKYITIKVGVA